MNRFYLGQCEYKWTHANTKMELLWVRRELGDELFKTVESNAWEWNFVRTDSQILPSDIYCRCDIYIEIPKSEQTIYFILKFPKAKLMEKIQ